MAYVEQEPFILSDTVEANIVFGYDLDQKWLQEVVSLCELETDLEIFPQGIQTIVGEQGVNISGG